MNAEARLRELGLELPEVPKLVTKYVPTSSSWISRGGGDSRGHTVYGSFLSQSLERRGGKR